MYSSALVGAVRTLLSWWLRRNRRFWGGGEGIARVHPPDRRIHTTIDANRFPAEKRHDDRPQPHDDTHLFPPSLVTNSSDARGDVSAATSKKGLQTAALKDQKEPPPVVGGVDNTGLFGAWTEVLRLCISTQIPRSQRRNNKQRTSKKR